jgi:hypothetical protein
MVGKKNIRSFFIVGSFIDLFMPDKNQGEPKIGPYHTQPDHHISSSYSPEKAGNNCEREQEQHDTDESKEGIN